jgi:guanine nucleotide-binding protein G(i) subunit alpha
MKSTTVPLDRYFPEYTGGNDINKAAKFILWRFTQTNRARLAIYPQYVSLVLSLFSIAYFAVSLTQATDTSNVC